MLCLVTVTLLKGEEGTKARTNICLQLRKISCETIVSPRAWKFSEGVL